MAGSAKTDVVGTISSDRVCGPAGVSGSSLPLAMWYADTPLMAYSSLGSCSGAVVSRPLNPSPSVVAHIVSGCHGRDSRQCAAMWSGFCDLRTALLFCGMLFLKSKLLVSDSKPRSSTTRLGFLMARFPEGGVALFQKFKIATAQHPAVPGA